jgi:NAD(P)-dependent dehydrogenase (short-subunit alcohol dehydrogenase family)
VDWAATGTPRHLDEEDLLTSTIHAYVAVITGASSGIGAATARALTAHGYRVALLARRVDRITALADELGNGALAIEADVTDRDALVAAAGRVREELGRVDVLVNNAGIMLLGPFTTEQREDYRRMVEVNLLGAITTTEVFLDQITAGGGDIVNISSVAGRVARAGNGVYGRRSGASTAGRSRCGRSCCPTSGSRSSSPAPWRPSCPPTSLTRPLATAPSSSTARSRSPPRTSPRSSPSP